MPVPELRIIGVTGIPEVKVGDHIGKLLTEAAARQGTPVQSGDVVAVTQKIVSKAEGRIVHLSSVKPSALAVSVATQWQKDARLVEVVLQQSARIVRMDHGVVITETKHGLICANAGVDASNIPGDDAVALLPMDPDASARRIRDEIRAANKADVAVLISDSFGRPWREGITNVAIGVAGMNPMRDYRGTEDSFGHPLRVTITAIADELVSAAELVSRKADMMPVALLRGFEYEVAEGSMKALLRPAVGDLFR